MVLCHWVAAEPEFWEGPGRVPCGGRPPKRRGEHFGSTVKGAKPLFPALSAQYRCWCRSGTCGQNCAVREGWESQEFAALKLCTGGWGEVPRQPPGQTVCVSATKGMPLSVRD